MTVKRTTHLCSAASHRLLGIALGAFALAFAGCSSEATIAEPTRAASTVPAEAAGAVVETAPADTTPADTAADDTAVAGTTPADTAAAADPLDDLDEDGEFDAACGTADLGGGLVVETLCNEGLRPTPEGGVIPTAQSLLWLPAPTRWEDLAEVDATARVARTADGRRVVIYVLGSDTLFDSGSASLRPTSETPLAAIVASIQERFPGMPVNVRGAADSVGEPGANQALSEQRAAAVAARLSAQGIAGELLSSYGLGELVPVAEENNPDGSVSEVGRQVNRRVEIVVG